MFANTFASDQLLESVDVNQNERQNRVQKGDVLFTQSSETFEEVGMSSVWLYDSKPFLNSFCMGWHPNTQKINPVFMGYLLRSPTIRKQIICKGQGISRINLAASRISNIDLYHPSLDEQLKIATLLSLLDRRIEVMCKILENLKKYKRSVFEAVFSQKIRLVPTDRQREWKKYKLSDFATRIIRKNGAKTDIPLTISAQYGLIDQRDFFSKMVASTDMSGYYLLRSGEFAYNRSTSSEYPFGSIKRLELYPLGAVSTLYLCFAINEDVVVSDLAKWYFESAQWHRGINEICAEGARNHGLLNVPIDGFFNTVHLLPSDRTEQIAIARYLSLLQSKYDRAVSELEQFYTIRKALQQQLFI